MRETRRIAYGAHVIEFRVERRERRTLEIAVEPDATVTASAPIHASGEEIDARVRRRAAWVLRQQRYFEAFLPRTTERPYVPGETHLYLGRHYRLKVESANQAGVKSTRGFLIVESPETKGGSSVRLLLDAWYAAKARQKFAERLEANLPRFSSPENHRPIAIMVRQLKRRWGSMSPAGRLLLNQRLIQAPTECIDYVITHELCHRAEAHHGPAFLDLLSRVMPDWPRRKARLERMMA